MCNKSIQLNSFLLLFAFILFPFVLSAQQDCSCSEPDSAINLKTRPAKSSSPGCKAHYFELYGESCMNQRMYDSAEHYMKLAIKEYINNHCSDISYLNVYKLLASINNTTGNYEKSIQYSLKVLPLAESTSNKAEQADCLLSIAQSFDRMKQSDKGIEYARKALSIAKLLPANSQKSDLLYKVASRFLWYYQDSKNMVVLDSAEKITHEQIAIARMVNDSGLLRRGFNHLNGYAHERKEYKKALQYVDSCMYYLNGVNDMALKATAYGDKADILMEMGNYTESRRFADSCLYLQQQVKNPETIANAYALLYQIGQRSENYKLALDAMNSYIEITDSLTKVEKTRAINELEKKYNQDKNEKTIKLLDQEKRIYLLLAVAGLLGLITIGFFIYQQSLKHKQKILETEQRLNRARMNPHFFFNALASLQTYALQGNDGKSIAVNLSKFAHIMRDTLESTYKDYITIGQEIDFLNEYLELQKVRFPKKFTYEITTGNMIDIDDQIIPSMILQPFVENSIEHGFTGIDYTGNIQIDFKKENDNLLITVIDNGKGLTVQEKGNGEHISRASQIIKDRLYLLNKKLKTKARFLITNNENETGAVVKIYLPVLHKADVNL